MAKAVEEALFQSDTLLVEAGTGTGKTWAYLVPALLSGQRVLVSTATRNLQEQIHGKDVPFLLESLGIDVEVAILKGRSNYLCLERIENAPPPTVDDPDLEAYLAIDRWSNNTETGDRAEVGSVEEDHPLWAQLTSTTESCLGSQCTFYDDCFVVKARRKAVRADLLIVNHHLFFADLSMREVWDAGLIPRPEAIIFDEAHGLEDIACYFFGSSLSNWRLKELVRDVKSALVNQGSLTRDAQTLLRGTTAASDAFFLVFMGFSPGTTRITTENIPSGVEDKRMALEVQLTGLIAMLKEKAVPGTPLAALEERTDRIRDGLLAALDVWNLKQVHSVERRGKGVFLHDLPIRVTQELEQGLFGGGQGIVFTSATLTTGGDNPEKAFEHFASRMGVDPCAKRTMVRSPFEYQKQTAIYLPKGLPMPNQEGFAEAACQEAKRLIEITEGGTFLLFTSHRMLNLFYDTLSPELPYPLFKQGNAPKDRLLADFKEARNGVLFGTSSFWEGVDVAGDALRSVIIDKLPFLSPGDPLIQGRLEDLEERGMAPFKSYQLPTAILALKQGFGRLIRRQGDRGIVSILDPRIQRFGYGKVFLRALPKCQRFHYLEQVEEWVKTNLNGNQTESEEV